MLERRIEDYLCSRVRGTGGEMRKVKWPCRRGAPDRLCMWPNGKHSFVELKRPGEKPRAEQVREHERLRKGGFDVWVIDSRLGADDFVAAMVLFRRDC